MLSIKIKLSFWLLALAVTSPLKQNVLANLLSPASGQLALGNVVRLVDKIGGVPPNGFGPQLSQDSSPEALEIIRSRGFIGEMYKTQSSDGTPLTLYHIINPLANPSTLNKYPIVLFHGLSGDASQMLGNIADVKPRKPVLGQPTLAVGDNNLAFMLANNNMDVWMMDARGSNLHNHDASDDINIEKSQKFWNYALDEQLLYDLPTLIDFVLRQTQSKKVMYIGYSESTFFMFALLSAVPEFADKLAAFVALAPVAYVTSIRGLTVPMMTPYLLIPDNLQGNYIPQPLVDTLGVGLRRFCGSEFVSHAVCGALARGVAGSGGATEDTPEFFASIIHTTSLRVFKHFLQLFSQRRFGMYDFGPKENMIRYGTPRPPDYPLSRIRLPTIILVRGDNDFLSTTEDQKILLSQLGVKPLLDIRIPEYNHLDFILARNAAQKVNFPVIQTLYQILLADGGSPLRDQSRTQVQVVPPRAVAYPNRDGSVSKRVVQGNDHLLGNLLEGIEYKKRLGALPVIGTTLSGYMGSPGALDIVQGLSWGADKLGDSISKLPDSIAQARFFG